MPLAPTQQASFQVPVCFKCNFQIQCAGSILPNLNILSVLSCYYVLFKRGDIMYWACHDVKSVINANARCCFCTSFTLYSTPTFQNKCVVNCTNFLLIFIVLQYIRPTMARTPMRIHSVGYVLTDSGRISILEIVLENVKALYN